MSAIKIKKDQVKSFKYSTSYYRNIKKQVIQSKLRLEKYGDCSKNVLKDNCVSAITSFGNLPPSLEHEVSEENAFVPFNVAANINYVLAELHETEIEEKEIFDQKINFIDGLKNWALNDRISHSSITSLLKLLKKCSTEFNYLPKCSKTLLETSAAVNIISMGTGEYWHNGLVNCLRKAFAEIENSMSIGLTFNIDGLPIFNSSKAEFWPILCTVNSPRTMAQPLIVGIYYGFSKPNLQEYLDHFVEELNDLVRNGLYINSYFIDIAIRCFLCDTPARSFLKGTVSSNAYHGCTKCTVVGEYYAQGHHMSYPRLNMPLRTDDSFRTNIDSDHHKEKTPLLKLPINMIEDFPVADSLHLLDLGAMKRCLKGWVHGSFNFRTKLSAKEINEISDLLVDFNTRKPTELHRAVRKLDCLSFWKGLEFRSFLLYFGPVVLKDYLQADVYHHFLLLSCAVTICSCNKYFEFLNVADVLFQEYIEKFIEIYGIDSISSNIHNLYHVVKDVEKCGPLPTFSTYPFESFLCRLKYLIRSGNKPLAQLAKRVVEFSNMNVVEENKSCKYPYVKMEQLIGDQKFKVYYFIQISSKYVLRTNKKDKWFMTKQNEIIEMRFAAYDEGSLKINGASIKRKYNFFDQPISSSHLNIYISPSESELNMPKYYELSDIKCKMLSLNYKDKFVFMPLIHTLD